MTKVYPGLVNLNGNLLCSIDVETTGRRAGYHEIIQIAIVPLNSDLRPLDTVAPFYRTMRPEYPSRQEKGAGYVHGLDLNELILHFPSSETIKKDFRNWMSKLDLPFSKQLTPMAHNWSFEHGFLTAWLGVDYMTEVFHPHARDGMRFALAINDQAAFAGHAAPFNRVGLGSLCHELGVTNEKPHDALHDALAEAEVYRALLHFDLF
jgi:DNA polymerase III epsilon subunit-like protein